MFVLHHALLEAFAHLDIASDDPQGFRWSSAVAAVLVAQRVSLWRLCFAWLHRCQTSLLADSCRKDLRS